MHNNLDGVADVLVAEGSFWTVLTRRISAYTTSFGKLKKASNSLRRLLRGREKVYTDLPAIRRLLVVDDEESIAFSMSDYFSQKGFKVDTAHEVEEAESLIEKTNYEAIILDLRLGMTPRPRGLDVIKFVHERSPNTRIVVLTACSSPDIEIEALHSGADVFLRKPKPLSQLAQVIQGLVESPRKRAAHHV